MFHRRRLSVIASANGNWRNLGSVPAPAFDAEALLVVARAYTGADEAICNGLRAIPLQCWEAGQTALTTAFDLASPTNSFGSQPHAWASFHEPQFTRGFVHFLDQGGPTQRTARCRAFVQAALRCSGNVRLLPADWQPVAVCAEAEENRIDILVELEDEGGRFGAAIEAKFWHRLTQGQLKKAENHVVDIRNWDVTRSAFVVIAPTADKVEATQLRASNNWRATSWWSFLRGFEREIEERFDCEEFRRFRRTIWYHAY